MPASIDILSEEACFSSNHPTKVAVAPLWWGLPQEKLSELTRLLANSSAIKQFCD